MDAVVFDLDGTLVDLFELHLAAFRKVISREYGLDFKRDDLLVYYGAPADEIARAFLEKHDVADVDYEAFVEKRREVLLNDLDSCAILPGALNLLDGLNDAGVPVGLATSCTPETGEAILSICGLGRFFDAQVFRSHGVKGKPAPDMFLAAARKLDVPPTRCAAVEDSVYGVQAAKAAGMKVVAVTTGSHTREQLQELEPELLVDSLASVGLKDIRGLFRG